MPNSLQGDDGRPARWTGRPYAYTVLDVFTTERFRGNPLAVIWDDGRLPAALMQTIAAEMNLSETVFLRAFPGEPVRAKIYTPRRELDFAGHPTIGSAAVIDDREPQPERFAIRENIGLVTIDKTRDGDGDRFWLTTPPVVFSERFDRTLAAQLVGVPEDALGPCEPQFVSAGSPLLFIQLRDAQAVDDAELRLERLSGALGSVNSGGTFVFAVQTSSGPTNAAGDVYARMFAPQLGIREDSATGGATGPLAAYMLRYGLLRNDRDGAFTSEQGTKMGRRSCLHVKIEPNGDAPVIRVGGSVVFTARGTLYVDDVDDRNGYDRPGASPG